MNHSIYKMILFLITLAISPSMQASDKTQEKYEVQTGESVDNQLGWYLGGQVGLATTDTSSADIDYFYQESELTASSVDIADSDFAASLFAGYQFSQYVALEVGYIDLGEREVTFVGESTDIDRFYDSIERIYPQSAKGLSAAAVASWSVTDDIIVSGKFGYWRWKGDYGTFENAAKVGKDSISGNDLWFGAELSYRLTQRSQVYFTAQRLKLDRSNNDLFGVGVRYFWGKS